MIQIICDSREQNPLEFSKVDGIEIVKECLPVGDYSARIAGSLVPIVIERKEIGDLFSSYTSNYEAERNKILRAKEAGLKFILAIEASATEVRRGHSYWSGGQLHESKKSGISMIRQLCSVSIKYDVPVWYSFGRRELAWMIQEYFLAYERYQQKLNEENLNEKVLSEQKREEKS